MGVADGARSLPCISLSERCLFATQARAKGGLNIDVWSTGGGPGLGREACGAHLSAAASWDEITL